MHKKLDRLNTILSRSPFRAISNPTLPVEYKFYDSRTWDHQCPPEWDEVTGTTIYGLPKSLAFASGIVLGYAQNTVRTRCICGRKG